MMTLDEIVEMWDGDSSIDDNQLGNAAIVTAKLHAKYLKVLIGYRLKKTKLQADYATMKRLKIRYFRGEMTRHELEEHGWEPWQYNRPIKSELDDILTADDDLVKIASRVDYVDTVTYAVESILNQIKQRDWQIKNAISWKQFLAGS